MLLILLEVQDRVAWQYINGLQAPPQTANNAELRVRGASV